MTQLFQVRPVQLLDVPLADGARVLRPEQAILRFANNKSVDVGALCYLERQTSFALGRSRRQSDGRKVLLTSLSAKRLGQVRHWIGHISSELRHSGSRVETIRDRVSRFVAFMGWADTAGWSAALDNEASGRSAFRAYVAYLRDRVARNDISLSAGARQQSTVLIELRDLLGIDDLSRGIILMRVNPALKEGTAPPDEATQSRILGVCDALFTGLSSLVLDKKPFPHPVPMPGNLALPGDKLWVFPVISWFMSPSMLAKRDSYWCPGWGYNYVEGRLSTLDELRAIKGFAGESDIRRRQAIRKARLQLEAANEGPRHIQRVRAALTAMNMFVILFLAQTGMNWAQVTELTWHDDYAVDATRQAFRTIKWRAGGKLVSFELPAAFMPTFRRYLELRKYLLSGSACDFLFFKQGVHGNGSPAQIRSGLHPTYIMLRRIDPELPAVHPRQWRAAKSDWLIRNTDPATAALVLQNAEKTVRNSYAEGSETTQLTEMSTFLDGISSAVLEKGVVLEGSIPRAIGVCASYGSPKPTTLSGVVQPDCKGPEGCLFCDKFKVHADEQDARKLLSCRHCLQQTAPMVGSDERVQALFGPVFDRIRVIVEEVAKREPEMVQRVTREVDEEGELDPYWARKLEMLMELGMVG